MTKVLIVEDDELLGRGMAEALSETGFDPILVTKGDVALARLRYGAPDVCVLDLMLPGLDGWRLIELARADGIGTPIVVVSARGSEHDRIHALEIGADDYLVSSLPPSSSCFTRSPSMPGGSSPATSCYRRSGAAGAPSATGRSTSA